MPGRRSGPTACARSGSSASTGTTGDLWAGEVGQDLWEWSTRSKRAATTAGASTKARIPFRPDRKKGPTPILKPIVEHPHSDFRSLTGGFVYRGSKYKELAGAYIYGDYDTGKIAALRYDGKKSPMQQELVDTPFRIIAFGEDHAGELYFVDFMNGTIHELVPAPKAEPTAAVPAKAQRDGAVRLDERPSSRAGADSLFGECRVVVGPCDQGTLPRAAGQRQIEFDTVEYPQPAPGAPRGWRFPDGTVLVKTFAMEMEKGNPASRRRLETRILHFEQLAGTEEVGDQVWRGYTYVWNDEQTDAELLTAKGPTASSRFAMPTRRAESASRPGTSRAGPNARCATPCPPSTCSASTRCR